MISLIHFGIAVIASFSLGFGAGRVKNVSKLAAVKAELVAFEQGVTTDVKSLVAKIKAKL